MPHFFRRPRAIVATALAGLAVAALPAAANAQSLQNVSIATGASYNYLVLDVAGGSTSNGAKVIQWAGHGTGNQRWNFVDQGNGTSAIVNQNSGKCLTSDGVAGHQLYQFTCVGSLLQQWRGTLGNVFDSSSPKLVNVASGVLMGVSGGRGAGGTPILPWDFHHKPK